MSKRFINLTVALITLMTLFIGAVGVSAEDEFPPSGNGYQMGVPTLNPPITVDAGWEYFSFAGVGSFDDQGAFTFTSAFTTVLKVTDSYASGDQFRVYDNGVSIGSTSVPTLGFDGVGADTDFLDPNFSHGSYVLPAGNHSITIEAIASPYGGGGAYLRVDGFNPAYVRSTGGAPWGENTNEATMDLVFGVGNWDDLRYETVVPATLFSVAYDFIYMEGSELNADELETFLTANQAALEAWVAAGGRVFINAAPNEGNGMAFGFGGVSLLYDISQVYFSGTGAAINTAHPIFNGPYLPAGTAFTGNAFSHAILSGGVPVMTGSAGTNLAEKAWGSGCAMFGGFTSLGWQLPNPNDTNLRANIISYLVNCAPAYSASASSLNFGNQLIGLPSAAQNVTVTNTGNANLHIGTLGITGNFAFSANTCNNATLAPAGTCSFSVVFTPLALAPYAGTVTIPDNASGNPHTVALSGTGVSVPDGDNLLINPGYDDFITAPKAWLYSVVNTPLSSLRDCNYYISPNCSLKLQGSRTTRVVTQTVTYNGLGGDDFIYGLSSAAQNVPAGGNYRFEIALFNRFNRVMYTQTLWFSDGNHGWETLSDTFTAPADFNKMRFRIYFQKGAGTAWFEDAFLMLWP